MCFAWILQNTAGTTLFSMNSLVFITETGYFYCAVRTEYIIQSNLSLGLTWRRLIFFMKIWERGGSSRSLFHTISRISMLVMRFLTNRVAVEISHPPYSPDLAPPDFFLLHKVTTALKEEHAKTSRIST